MEASTPGGHLKAATITITTQSAPLRPEVS
jgi:hypothetical protein